MNGRAVLTAPTADPDLGHRVLGEPELRAARRGWRGATFLLALMLGLAACGLDSPTEVLGGGADRCTAFPAWESSPLVLPYPVGESYFVNQANCSGFGHSGFWRYGYDFTMSIGTLVTAAGDGTVLHVQEQAVDGDRARTNLVIVQNADGTVALYSHLTQGGALVEAGQAVAAGDPVGLSGDTGNTGGLPHLHFSLHPCGELPGLPGLPGTTGGCATMGATFRNTDRNPDGLVAGRSYRALPFR